MFFFCVRICQIRENFEPICSWFVGNIVLIVAAKKHGVIPKSQSCFCIGCGSFLCNGSNHMEPFVQSWCGV